MSKIVLTKGPSEAQLQSFQDFLKMAKHSEHGVPTAHYPFHVMKDGEPAQSARVGMSSPRMKLRITEIKAEKQLPRKDVVIRGTVAEDMGSEPIMVDGVDISKAGAEIEILYSSISENGEVIAAKMP